MAVRLPRLLLAVAVLAAASFVSSPRASAQDFEQTILGPGLYVFQTRVRGATCGDEQQTGFVSTFIGTIDGVPGARRMEMKLLNNRYWPSWALTVRRSRVVVGEASVPAQQRESRFEVRFERGRFVGEGTRSYFSTVDGERRRCTVTVDVLLRRFDV